MQKRVHYSVVYAPIPCESTRGGNTSNENESLAPYVAGRGGEGTGVLATGGAPDLSYEREQGAGETG